MSSVFRAAAKAAADWKSCCSQPIFEHFRLGRGLAESRGIADTSSSHTKTIEVMVSDSSVDPWVASSCRRVPSIYAKNRIV